MPPRIPVEISATIAPTTADAAASRSAGMRYGTDAGSRSRTSACHQVAEKLRISSTECADGERRPRSVPTATGKKARYAAITATDIHGFQVVPPMCTRPPQPTTSGARATSGTVWDSTTYGSRPRSAISKRSISIPSAIPTATPSSSPAIATRKVNQTASSTATPTEELCAAPDSGRPKRRSTSQTCGMDASSARGSTRAPNSEPPSGLPTTLYASHSPHTSASDATNQPARDIARRRSGRRRAGTGRPPSTTATTAGSAPTPVIRDPGCRHAGGPRKPPDRRRRVVDLMGPSASGGPRKPPDRRRRVVDLMGSSAFGGARWTKPGRDSTSGSPWTSGGYGGRPRRGYSREQLSDRRDDVLAVRGQGVVLAIVLQVDGELVDAEPGQLGQPGDVLLDRPEDAEPVDDLVRHERRVDVPGPAVLVVVVALPAGDVVGQRLGDLPRVAVPGDDVGDVVADHPAEPPALLALVVQVVPDVRRRRHADRDRVRVPPGRGRRLPDRLDGPGGDVRVGQLQDEAVADLPRQGQRLRPVRGDPDLQPAARGPGQPQGAAVVLHRPPVAELAHHVHALAQRGQRGRPAVGDPYRRVAPADPAHRPVAEHLVEGGEGGGGDRPVPGRRVGHHGADRHGPGGGQDLAVDHVRLLPQQVRVERPHGPEAAQLGLPGQLDHPGRRRGRLQHHTEVHPGPPFYRSRSDRPRRTNRPCPARPENSPPETITDPRESTVSTLPATSRPSYAE